MIQLAKMSPEDLCIENIQHLLDFLAHLVLQGRVYYAKISASEVIFKDR